MQLLVKILAVIVVIGVLLSIFLLRSFLGGPPSLGPEFEVLEASDGEDGLPRRVRHTPSGITLVLVPAGRFTMGAPEGEHEREEDEVPREVTIERAFYLGETEVTVEQWRTLISGGREDIPEDGSLPMGGVSWHRAVEFIGRLNGGEEGPWRLPTEAEWEYACRAGTTTAFSFGDDLTTDQANFNGRYPYRGGARGLDRGEPTPVRSFPPNAWGLYDMHGNVWEWCEDKYVAHPEQGQLPKEDPGAPRVMRGGGFTAHAKRSRAAYRDGYPPNSNGQKYGFRVAMSLP